MRNAADIKPLAENVRLKMEDYRRMLLEAGMLEPTKWSSSGWHWLFYRPATELTAFVVNLSGTDDGIGITFGYASTAFTRMAGDENALIERGVQDSDVTIRERLVIRGADDETKAAMSISRMYERYRGAEKDELLSAAKEKRKAFIQQIAQHLKPLGFRKKANRWTRSIDSDYYVMFSAQKSAYADEYYFNIDIGRSGSDRYGDCYSARIACGGEYSVDWHALGADGIEVFLNDGAVPALSRIIETPLTELGKAHYIWQGCSCDRRKCETCWVEKNMWEAKEG